MHAPPDQWVGRCVLRIRLRPAVVAAMVEPPTAGAVHAERAGSRPRTGDSRDHQFVLPAEERHLPAHGSEPLLRSRAAHALRRRPVAPLGAKAGRSSWRPRRAILARDTDSQFASPGQRAGWCVFRMRRRQAALHHRAWSSALRVMGVPKTGAGHESPGSATSGEHSRTLRREPSLPLSHAAHVPLTLVERTRAHSDELRVGAAGESTRAQLGIRLSTARVDRPP